MEYVKRMGVYEKVHISDCFELSQKAPIRLKWVDVNKIGCEKEPNYRQRPLAMELKTDWRPDPFSATPPLELFKAMLYTRIFPKG